MSDAKIVEAVNQILNENKEALENQTLTKKNVRRLVESRLGLERKALDEKKAEVNAAIQDFISRLDDSEEEEADLPQNKRSRSDDDEGSWEPKPTKRAKKAPAKKAEPGKARMIAPQVYENREPPKKLKQHQEDLMGGDDFLQNAEDIELNIHGNLVTLCARTFSSGNRGWYGGGKILVKVGKKRVWGQIGCNLTIPGSKMWDSNDY